MTRLSEDVKEYLDRTSYRSELPPRKVRNKGSPKTIYRSELVGNKVVFTLIKEVI